METSLEMEAETIQDKVEANTMKLEDHATQLQAHAKKLNSHEEQLAPAPPQQPNVGTKKPGTMDIVNFF